MNNIITISREFGSGGREVGKRLAEELGYDYYDREIIEMLAKETDLDETYLNRTLEHGIGANLYPISIGHTFAMIPTYSDEPSRILQKQTEIIKKIAAKGNCVIVGRNANVILSEYQPLKIFVYADLESKIARCKSRASVDENLTDKEYEKKIKQVDQHRAKTHNILCEYRWGDTRGYDLCVNTSHMEIKKAVKAIAVYARYYFE